MLNVKMLSNFTSKNPR